MKSDVIQLAAGLYAKSGQARVNFKRTPQGVILYRALSFDVPDEATGMTVKKSCRGTVGPRLEDGRIVGGYWRGDMRVGCRLAKAIIPLLGVEQRTRLQEFLRLDSRAEMLAFRRHWQPDDQPVPEEVSE